MAYKLISSVVVLLACVSGIIPGPVLPGENIWPVEEEDLESLPVHVVTRNIEPPSLPSLTKTQTICSNIEYTFTTVGQISTLASIDNPNNYPNGLDCSWFLTSPVGTKLTAQCSDFDVPCETDYMYFSLIGSPIFSDAKTGYCGNGGNFTLTSTTNRLNLGFKSGVNTKQRKYTCKVTVVSEHLASDDSAPTTVAPFPAALPTGTGPASCNCGEQSAQTRIVGGADATAGEFPWRALVFTYDGTTGKGGICGGTIIHPSWILTAAHCTMYFKPGWKINVYYNTTVNPLTTGQRSQMIQSDFYIQHPVYTRAILDSDLTLIHLSHPIEYGKNVGPICLPYSLKNETFEGKQATVSGFGTTEAVPVNTKNPNFPSSTLKKVVLPLLATGQCQHFYKKKITENMFGTYNPGTDSCQGDSGGSLDYYNPSNGLWYSIGVTSFGAGCAQKKYPGVYVKVANYLNWIEANTGETFCRK